MVTCFVTRLLSVLIVMTIVVPVAAQELDYDIELAEIDRQIAEAQQEAAQYSGGLILVMTKLRIEFLKSSRALIEFGRLQGAVRSQPQSNRIWRWLSDSEATPVEKQQRLDEIGLLCGKLDSFAVPMVVNQTEKLIAYGANSLESYIETDDEMLFRLENNDGKKINCRLNRYTLEIRCQNTEATDKDLVEQCRFSGAAKIPNSGQYWLNCGVPGKPDTNSHFKIVLGSNSAVEGGYLNWRNVSNGGVVTEECQINRFSGAVYCSTPDSLSKDDSTSKRWHVLDDPECRVLPRKL